MAWYIYQSLFFSEVKATTKNLLGHLPEYVCLYMLVRGISSAFESSH